MSEVITHSRLRDVLIGVEKCEEALGKPRSRTPEDSLGIIGTHMRMECIVTGIELTAKVGGVGEVKDPICLQKVFEGLGKEALLIVRQQEIPSVENTGRNGILKPSNCHTGTSLLLIWEELDSGVAGRQNYWNLHVLLHSSEESSYTAISNEAREDTDRDIVNGVPTKDGTTGELSVRGS